MTRIALRHLTAADIPFADSLRKIAGWNQTTADWQRFLELSPKGCLFGESDGRPAATATTIAYGHGLGWIGMVLVHPDFRRRGMGRILVEHSIEVLRAAGIRSIKLDATPEGREVYLRLGFQDEFTITRYTRGARAASKADDAKIRPGCPGDLDRMVALDSDAIGACREKLLARLMAESAAFVFAEQGEIQGFGLLRPGARAHYLGPLVAANHEAAVCLASSICSTSKPIYWDIPDQQTVLANWAGANGFAPQRSLTRMYWGENVQGRAPKTCFGIAAPELG